MNDAVNVERSSAGHRIVIATLSLLLVALIGLIVLGLRGDEVERATVPVDAETYGEEAEQLERTEVLYGAMAAAAEP